MTVKQTARVVTGARSRRTLTMFSYGYWGSGRNVGGLVRAVAAGERDRGYEPPLWVDIRLRRNVRAAGFRGDEFEKRMGDRYLWMPDLGNESIANGEGGIRIRRPAAADELLDLAISHKESRVLFFCACEHPCQCHRRTVSKLLITRARRRGIRLRVVEWPGDDATRIDISTTHSDLTKLLRGDLWRVHLPKALSAKAAATVPWGSVARLHAHGEQRFAILGAARFGTHGGYLPILEWSQDRPAIESSRRWRRKLAVEPLSSDTPI